MIKHSSFKVQSKSESNSQVRNGSEKHTQRAYLYTLPVCTCFNWLSRSSRRQTGKRPLTRSQGHSMRQRRPRGQCLRRQVRSQFGWRAQKMIANGYYLYQSDICVQPITKMATFTHGPGMRSWSLAIICLQCAIELNCSSRSFVSAQVPTQVHQPVGKTCQGASTI